MKSGLLGRFSGVFFPQRGRGELGLVSWKWLNDLKNANIYGLNYKLLQIDVMVSVNRKVEGWDLCELWEIYISFLLSFSDLGCLICL